MHQMYDKLKELKPEAFFKLYEPSIQETSSGKEIRMIYTNRTRLSDVCVNQNDENLMQEYTFICLTIDNDIDKKRVHLHYVSTEYNVSDTDNTNLAGRFLFYRYVKGKTWAEVDVFAEEPARSESAPGARVERAYLQNRHGNMPGSTYMFDEEGKRRLNF
jgi:hypothetical protein